MMLDSQRSARVDVELIDAPAIVADLKALAKTTIGRERELRTAVAQRLKLALTQARARAEQLLLKDRHGRRCAERYARCRTTSSVFCSNSPAARSIRLRCHPKQSTWP